MSERIFAPWVEPIAARFAATRREVADIAHDVREDAWASPSPVPGWTVRDVLAHLAEGDMGMRYWIQVVLDGGDTDFRPRNEGREERIAAGLQRGAGLTIDELIAKVLTEGEETQELLARLGDDHGEVEVITSRTNPAPQSVAECLAGYHHDEEHIEHLKPALRILEVTG